MHVHILLFFQNVSQCIRVVMSDADIEQNVSLVASNLAVEVMLMLVLQLCCNYNSLSFSITS